jgi:hypothetical protein
MLEIIGLAKISKPAIKIAGYGWVYSNRLVIGGVSAT